MSVLLKLWFTPLEQTLPEAFPLVPKLTGASLLLGDHLWFLWGEINFGETLKGIWHLRGAHIQVQLEFLPITWIIPLLDEFLLLLFVSTFWWFLLWWLLTLVLLILENFSGPVTTIFLLFTIFSEELRLLVPTPELDLILQLRMSFWQSCKCQPLNSLRIEVWEPLYHRNFLPFLGDRQIHKSLPHNSLQEAFQLLCHCCGSKFVRSQSLMKEQGCTIIQQCFCPLIISFKIGWEGGPVNCAGLLNQQVKSSMACQSQGQTISPHWWQVRGVHFQNPLLIQLPHRNYRPLFQEPSYFLLEVVSQQLRDKSN